MLKVSSKNSGVVSFDPWNFAIPALAKRTSRRPGRGALGDVVEPVEVGGFRDVGLDDVKDGPELCLGLLEGFSRAGGDDHLSTVLLEELGGGKSHARVSTRNKSNLVCKLGHSLSLLEIRIKPIGSIYSKFYQKPDKY